MSLAENPKVSRDWRGFGHRGALRRCGNPGNFSIVSSSSSGRTRRRWRPGSAFFLRCRRADAPVLVSAEFSRISFAAMLKSLIDWYLSALQTGGYPLIALLMAIESSIVPLPSELIIPPAAHMAYVTGQFSMVGIVLAGTAGSWVGAAIMYWASRIAGRPLVLRFGPYLMIKKDKI